MTNIGNYENTLNITMNTCTESIETIFPFQQVCNQGRAVYQLNGSDLPTGAT